MDNLHDIVKNAESLALFSAKNTNEHKFLAREALAEALRNDNSLLYIFPETISALKEKWADIVAPHQNPPAESQTRIRLPKNHFDIKEIGYEENEDFFILNINSNSQTIKKEDIVFETAPTTIDAAFYFDPVESAEKVGEKIFIAPENGRTIAEHTFEIIQKIEPEKSLEETQISTLLLASLFLETNNLARRLTDKDVLKFTGELLEMGADKDLVNEILNKPPVLSFSQILGRALARTRVNEALRSVWAFLSLEDLKKTGCENADVSFFAELAGRVADMAPSQPTVILLWQKPEGVFSLVRNKNEFSVDGPYKNFSEAELKTQQGLKEIDI